MAKKTLYIAVDVTANMNPYLTLGPTDRLVWGPRREEAFTFQDEKAALQAGKAVMEEVGAPGAAKRVRTEKY